MRLALKEYSSPFFIYIILTQRCNYHCQFCIRKNLDKEDDIDKELALSMLFYLAKFIPDATIILTGGEPFLYNGIYDILQESIKIFPRVVITTNGSFTDKDVNILKRYLNQNLFLQISLDGSQEYHDKARGTNAFSSAINNLHKLLEYSSHISISTTVNNNNIENVIKLGEFLNHVSFAAWKISQEQVQHPTKNNIIEPIKWNTFVDRIIEISSHKLIISKSFDFNIFDKSIQKAGKKIDGIINNCGFGKNKLYITPEFNVLPCSCLDIKAGNILTDKFTTIMKNICDLSRFIIPENSVCFHCKYQQICHCGCPGYSYKVFHRFGMGDIRCPLIRV